MIKVSIAVENQNGSVELIKDEFFRLNSFIDYILKKASVFYGSFLETRCFEAYKKTTYNSITGYAMALAQNGLADYNFIYTKDGVWRISCVEKIDEYATLAHYMYPLQDYINKHAKKI
jgi:hypothetical protein